MKRDISPEAMIRHGVRMGAILVIVLVAGGYLLGRSVGNSRDQVRSYVVKRDLRALAAAEQRWYAAHGTYSSDPAALGVTPARLVSFSRVNGSESGWRAEARHAEAGPRSCVIWEGDMAVADRPSTAVEGRIPEAGVPACDGDR